MDKTPNEIVTSNLKLIYSTGYKPYRMYAYYKTDKMASDAITLVVVSFTIWKLLHIIQEAMALSLSQLKSQMTMKHSLQ